MLMSCLMLGVRFWSRVTPERYTFFDIAACILSILAIACFFSLSLDILALKLFDILPKDQVLVRYKPSYAAEFLLSGHAPAFSLHFDLSIYPQHTPRTAHSRVVTLPMS